MKAWRLALLLPLLVSIGACDSWYGEKKKPLPGKRISVLAHEKKLEPDPSVKRDIRLPRPEGNEDWPQPGGLSTHAMHHMEVGPSLKKAWSTSIGSGSTSDHRLTAEPVVAMGRVFAMDRKYQVTALDAKTGNRIWQISARPKEDDGDVMGGGIAFDEGKLFAATGFGEVMAIDPQDGKIHWRQSMGVPLRGAPAARAGRVFVVTADNQTIALRAEDGGRLWSHTGISEIASLLGGSTPAVDNSIVVVPYSSGQLVALRADNGTALWTETLSTVRRTDQISTLSDIRGRPIIDRGRVFAVGHADLAVGIDVRTGRRLWEAEIGGIYSPWIAGDYLFFLTNGIELVAMEAKSGRIVWVLPLQRWKNEEDRKGPVQWTGPVLAGDRLIVASSHGYAIAVSPYTGEVLGGEKMPDDVNLAPIVAGKSLYFLTENGDIVAYR